MNDERSEKSVVASQSQDFFQLMFDAVDLYASIWQPTLKSIGRWNLEVAGLAMRQGQASLQLSRALARSASPGEWTSASVRYWDQISSQYAQSSQRLAATVEKSVKETFEPSVVPLPVRQHQQHDMIVLPANDIERKVA